MAKSYIPYKTLSKPLGLRLLGGNLSPEYSAVLKLAGSRRFGQQHFYWIARVFNGEQSLLDFLDSTPGI